MGFYILFWLIVVIMMIPKPKLSRQSNKIFQMIGGFVYVFLSAFRNVTGNYNLDIYAYYERFNMADCSLLQFVKISNFEPGYSLLVWLIKNTTNSFVVFLIIIHSFIYVSHVVFIDKITERESSSDIKISHIYIFILAAVLGINLLSAFYIQRNIISLCFAYYYVISLNKRKWIKSAILIILAVSFHYSAVILFFPLVVFYLSRKNNKSTFLKRDYKKIKHRIILLEILILLFLLVSIRFMIEFMSGSSKYRVYKNEGSTATITIAVASYIMIMYFLYLEHINQASTNAENIGITSMSTLLIVPLQNGYSIMYRMYLFFIPLLYVMFVYIAVTCPKKSIRLLNIIIMMSYFTYRCYCFFTGELIYIGETYKLLN